MIQQEDLGGREQVSLREHKQLGIIVHIAGNGFALGLDEEEVDIVDVKVAHAENGGEHGICKSGINRQWPHPS